MKVNKESIIVRIAKEEQGQMLPWFALVIAMLFLGMGAFVLDVGHAYFSYQELQAATDAAALAGAKQIYYANAISTATAYSGTTGVTTAPNTYSNLQSVSMVPGYPQTECLTTIQNMGVLCEGPETANAIIVKEQAKVPTFFARVFGINTMTLSASATATKGLPVPLNVALLIDTTLSMNTYDSYCGATQMQCALQGSETLLTGLAPSVDSVSVFTFPNVDPTTVQNDQNCNPPQNQNPSFYSTPAPGLATSTPYTLPTIPSNASTGYVVQSGYGTYQVTSFLNDYRTSNSSTTANSNSALVGTLGQPATSTTAAVQGCLAPPNQAGEFGTYLAGVINAAQAALAQQNLTYIANHPANAPNPVNILIILSDGNTNASGLYGGGNQFFVTNLNNSGTYPSQVGDCGQAIVAANTAKANNTLIFSIAYGSAATGKWIAGDVNDSNCPTDQNGFFQTYGLGSNVSSYPNISPCQTMKDIATPDTSLVQFFWSDPSAPGGDPGCTSASGSTALNDAFASIVGSLTKARLIPDGTT
jgi:hypothetical protein